MPFYKNFEDKPSKQNDWRDDALTLRPGQSNGGRPSHAARNQGGLHTQGRPVEDRTMERAGFAPRKPREGYENRAPRQERSDRSDRFERSDRPMRQDRPERQERTDRFDRFDRPARQERPVRE